MAGVEPPLTAEALKLGTIASDLSAPLVVIVAVDSAGSGASLNQPAVVLGAREATAVEKLPLAPGMPMFVTVPPVARTAKPYCWTPVGITRCSVYCVPLPLAVQTSPDAACICAPTGRASVAAAAATPPAMAQNLLIGWLLQSEDLERVSSRPFPRACRTKRRRRRTDRRTVRRCASP